MKQLQALGILVALVLAGCSNNPASPGAKLAQNDQTLYQAGQPLLDEAALAFSDLLPQTAPLQTPLPRELTLLNNSRGDVVLIGGPWRPPYPYPIPPVDQPVILWVRPPKPQSPEPGQAHLALLRQDPQSGQFSLEWQGARGRAPVRVPASLTLQGDFSAHGKYVVKRSFKLFPPTVDLIIVRVPDVPTDPFGRMHLVAPLPPDTLPGRPIRGTLDPASYDSQFKEVCCGRPKPFPPLFPPIWLHREDLTLVALPYDNPKVSAAKTVDDLVGENLGFIYLRKKPWTGTPTDCGPFGVWCPPEADPFLNLRLIKNPDGSYALQLTQLSDANQVRATLPVQVLLQSSLSGPGHIDIEDRIEDVAITIHNPVSAGTVSTTFTITAR